MKDWAITLAFCEITVYPKDQWTQGDIDDGQMEIWIMPLKKGMQILILGFESVNINYGKRKQTLIFNLHWQR